MNFKRVLKIELYRAFINKLFIFAVLAGSIITISHVIFNVIPMTEFLDDYLNYDKPMMDVHGVFNKWIGGQSFTMQPFLYYLLLPILVTIPFADSFFTDKKSCYIDNIFIRTNKKNYYFSKLIAVFFSAGIVILIPLLINLMLTAMILPSINPQISGGTFPIVANSMWAELFYTHPYIYVFGYLLIDFIFAGLIASISLVVSFWAEHRFIVLTGVPSTFPTKNPLRKLFKISLA